MGYQPTYPPAGNDAWNLVDTWKVIHNDKVTLGSRSSDSKAIRFAKSVFRTAILIIDGKCQFAASFERLKMGRKN